MLRLCFPSIGMRGLVPAHLECILILLCMPQPSQLEPHCIVLQPTTYARSFSLAAKYNSERQSVSHRGHPFPMHTVSDIHVFPQCFISHEETEVECLYGKWYMRVPDHLHRPSRVSVHFGMLSGQYKPLCAIKWSRRLTLSAKMYSSNILSALLQQFLVLSTCC